MERITTIKVEQLGGRTTIVGVEQLKEKKMQLRMNEKSRRTIDAKVEQLGGAITIADDEQCFLVILRLKDL